LVRWRIGKKGGVTVLRVSATVLGLCATASAQDPVWMVSPINGHWYALTETDTWSATAKVAESWGGCLATVRSQPEFDWLASAFSGGFIGLYQDLGDPSYAEPGGAWKWSSAEPLTFTKWGPGEPNNRATGVEDLGETTAGGWNDVDGLKPRPGIVELTSGDCDGNGVPDVYEIAVGLASDVNGNGIPDACEPGSWGDVGQALIGSNGEPSLSAIGTLFPNDLVTLSLSNARPFASATLVIGFSSINAPFKGGVLVPAINIVFGQTTDFFGEAIFGGLWPSGVPSGFVTYFQYWIMDDAGPVGFAASNGLSGASP